jgi:hypothetical protein
MAAVVPAKLPQAARASTRERHRRKLRTMFVGPACARTTVGLFERYTLNTASILILSVSALNGLTM